MVFIGGVLVVALFAALLAPYFIDWTDFRKDFETQASRIIGKKVVVHGSVDARLLPFPMVTMNDVRVGETGGGEALVTAERFTMETELAPFLSGEALIYNMHIENPKVKLRLTEDGTFDWVKTGVPQIPASTVVLEKVTVSNGEVQIIDEQTGHNRHVTGLDMQLSAKTLAGPWKVSGAGAVDGQSGSFVMNTSVPENGRMFLKLRLLPEAPGIVAELDGSLGLKNFRPNYAGSFRIREKYRSETAAQAEAEAQSAAPRISGEFELFNDRLRIGKYEFQMGNPADPYIVTGEATIDAGRQPDFLLTAVGQQIDLGRLGANPEATGDNQQTVIPFRDRLNALLTLAADVPIPPMPGKADIRLPALIAGDTVIREIRLSMRPDRNGWLVDDAEAQLPGRTVLNAKGKLTLAASQSFEGELLLASRQPSGFAEWVTGAVPETVRKLKTAGFSANVSLTPDLQRFENLEIAFGPATLKGRLEHQIYDGQAPSLSAELSGNAFDLDTVMALGGLLTGEASPKSLIDHRIAARLKFDKFSAFGVQAGDFNTTFTLAEGGVSAARVSIGDFYGARVEAEAGMAGLGDKPAGNAKISVQASDASALLALAADRLPPHPALRRLAASAPYFADSDLMLELAIGKGDWPVEATLTGTTHGSQLQAKLAAQSLHLSDPQGLSIDASLSNPDAWVLLGQAGVPTIPFDADQDGVLKLKVNQPEDADPQIMLDYTSGTTTIRVEGQSALDAQHFLNGSYALTVDSGDLAPYLIMSSMTLPRISEGLPFAATAHIYAAPEAVTLDSIDGDADGNAFSGIVSFDRKQGSSSFAGNLKFNSVDLLWLAESVYGQITDPLTGELSALAVPKVTGLPADATLALSARKFQLGNLGDVDDFRGTLTALPGRVTISDSSGAFSTGRFKGKVELGNTDGNAFLRASLNIDNAALKTTFWQYAGEPAISAKTNLAVVIDSTGTSPQAMLETATGSGAMRLSDLNIRGLNDHALGDVLGAADLVQGDISESTVRPIVEPALFNGAMHLQSLDIPFTITGARLRADKINAENARVSIDAQTGLSLEDAQMESRVDLKFNPGDQALAGADPLVTLGWTGPLVAPERSVDITQMTSFLSLRKFEQERRRVEILQAKMAEKQRLRRETGLYRAREAERLRLKEKAAAEERLFRQAQEKRAQIARQEEEERQKSKQLRLDNPAVDNFDFSAPLQ
nr:AsmA family protein [Rhizobium setariae]